MRTLILIEKRGPLFRTETDLNTDGPGVVIDVHPWDGPRLGADERHDPEGLAVNDDRDALAVGLGLLPSSNVVSLAAWKVVTR